MQWLPWHTMGMDDTEPLVISHGSETSGNAKSSLSSSTSSFDMEHRAKTLESDSKTEAYSDSSWPLRHGSFDATYVFREWLNHNLLIRMTGCLRGYWGIRNPNCYQSVCRNILRMKGSIASITSVRNKFAIVIRYKFFNIHLVIIIECWMYFSIADLIHNIRFS